MGLENRSFVIGKLSGKTKVVEIVNYIESVEMVDCIAESNSVYIWNESIWMDAGWQIESYIAALCSHVDIAYSSNTSREVKRLLAAKHQCDKINCCTKYIPFLNGYWDIDSKQLIEPQREAYFTWQFAFNYNKDAKCPNFDHFLSTVVLNPTERRWLCLYLAYCCTSKVGIQKALMIYGRGNNGKSTLIDLIKYIWEGKVAGIPLQMLGERFNTSQYRGKLLNIFDDLKSEEIENDSWFKLITGSEYLDGEVKGQQERLLYRNITRLIFTANEIPIGEGLQDGFFRRWLVITFGVKIENPDFGLGAKLRAEAEGILAYLISLLPDIEQGLKDIDIAEMKMKWYSGGNSMAAYYAQCDLVPDGWVETKDLYSDYADFCARMNLAQQFTLKQLGHFLTHRGINHRRKQVNGELNYYYVGILPNLKAIEKQYKELSKHVLKFIKEKCDIDKYDSLCLCMDSMLSEVFDEWCKSEKTQIHYTMRSKLLEFVLIEQGFLHEGGQWIGLELKNFDVDKYVSKDAKEHQIIKIPTKKVKKIVDGGE
jgi:P4 family phage/plasmid primase-like protien